MAVPKKKTSKARSRRRYAVWVAKAADQATKAFALGKSVLSERNTGFYYPPADVVDEEEE